MAKISVAKGATSVLVRVFIQDSSSTTGGGLTGLTSGSAGLACYRARDDDGNAAGTSISLTGGTRGTWSSGGFVEKDATNMAGEYEFGIPNAALATGSRTVQIHMKGATNMVPLVFEIELTGVDNQDATRGGMAALPNAAANASGGLITFGTGTGQQNVSGGRVDANVLYWNSQAVPTPNVNGVPIMDEKYILGTAVTQGGAGRLAAAFTKLFDVVSPTGTINSLPDAVPGAANGLLIAGSNATTTFAGISVTSSFEVTNLLVDNSFVVTSAFEVGSFIVDGVINGTFPANVIQVGGSAPAADRLMYFWAAVPKVIVDTATFTSTSTVFETEDTTDSIESYREQTLYGATGANAGITVAITSYTYSGNNKVKLTVETLKAAPADGDIFVRMGRIEQ